MANKISELCIAKQFEQAFYLSQELAKENDHVAFMFLGWMYYLGIGTVDDVPEGFKWMQLASESGSVEALFGLGRILEDIDKLDMAKEFYEASAKKGYLPSQYRLAKMYWFGLGGLGDRKLALEQFKNAGEQGHYLSMLFYGKRLLYGYKGFWMRVIGFYYYVTSIFYLIYCSLLNKQSVNLIYTCPTEFTDEVTRCRVADKYKRVYKFLRLIKIYD